MYHFRGTPRYAHAEGYTNLCFSESGEYIITCGSEGDVRIWHGIEDDDPQAKCVGEKAFAIAQKGDKLYVGSDHNYVQILTFPDGELDHILTRFTAPVTTIDVSKTGNFVAAGSEDMQIQIVNVSTSVVKYLSGHKAPVLNVAIDPKLEYLGSSSCDGTVKIWKVEDQTVVKEWSDVLKLSNSFQHSELLCRSSWEPCTGRLFAIPFSTEIKVMQRDTWNTIITLFDVGSPQAFSLTSWSNCGRYLAGSTSKGEICVWNTLISTLVSSSTNSSNVNISSLSWHPDSSIRQIAYCDFKGQLVSVENCSPKPNVTEETKSKETLVDNVTESRTDDRNSNLVSLIDDDDDPDAISLEKIKSNYNSFLEDESLEKGDDDSDMESLKSSSIRAPVLPSIELQPPFQPTSTPVHLQRRFMVFNDCGYVKQTNTEEENVIDVDFHDASIHHAFRINNMLNHTLAALNTEALVLACEKTDESVSRVVCRRFNSWDGSKEWNVELPTNETIEAIAVGSKWLAVATNLRFLRLFTLGGFQRELICLLGSVVSMNAYDELLIVVYHSSMGLPGEQNLSFSVYQITHDVKMLVAAQPVPLNPKSTLKWVGFSDLLNPCIVDSDGVLKLFISDSGLWKPICLIDEQGKESSSHHFIIGVSEERQNIRCISCKGSYYPSTTPHPFICEIPWMIPMCETEVDKGMLEEKLWRYSIAKECSSKDDKNLHKDYLQTVLKLFSLSTKINRSMRVYDLCDIGNQSTMTELALKYASKLNNSLLVDKLSQLKEKQIERHMESELSEEGYVGSSNSDYNYNRRYEDRRREQENEQSQELFSERSFTDSNATRESGSVSLIAETKRKINLNESRPVLPKRKINPFKKNTQPNDSASNPVSENSHSISSPVIESKKDSLDRPFSEWFKLEKENLEQEFPDVDVIELARRGAKKYNLMKKNRQDVLENKDVGDTKKGNNYGIENKKRKTTEEDSSNNAEKSFSKKKPPLFKLQAFDFKKSS